MYARISAFLVAFALALTGLAAAQERFGTLRGTVTDVQKAAVPGVTVTITNVESGEVRNYVTDAEGKYLAQDLNPGRYNVSFELQGFRKVERTEILVLLGRAFDVDAELAVGGVTEVVQVVGEVPLVDTRGTMISHNVTAEEIDRLPKGRSFQSLALTAPSVNAGEIEGGIQVNGASGSENTFTVDGITTNSLVGGHSRQDTVFEYLEEVQVKTTGIQAEYGGALGGVLSAVTKSGGNTFRGEAHYYFQGSALAARPVKRLVMDPITEASAFFVQDNEDPLRINEFGGSLGGPIVHNHLFFFGSISPRNENRTNTYQATDATQDIERDIWRQQMFGKISFRSSRLTATGSALWTPTKTEGTLSSYNGATPNAVTNNSESLQPQINRGYETNQVNTSGTANLVISSASFVGMRGGLFHDRYSDTGIPLTTSYAYQSPTTPLNAIIPPSLQGGVNVNGVNTPRAQITEFDTTKRVSFDIDYNHVFSAAGFHSLKGGYGYQHFSNDINAFYPGGYIDIFWDQSFTFSSVNRGRGVYGYYTVNDRKISNETSSRIHSLFAQDQWTMQNLTLNLGIRLENEVVPTFRPDILKNAFEFGWGEKVAPRLGGAYDLRGNGATKLFASWGRYYDWTKYQLPRGSFGAETWCQHYRALDTLALDTISLSNMPGKDLWVVPGSCRDRRVPSFQNEIDPDAKPMYQDSFSAGVEHQLGRNSVLTVHYTHNDLRETIEDIGFLNDQGDEGYLIGNPGRGATAIQFPTGATPLGQPTPKPKRIYDAIDVSYTRRYANNWFLSANYTWSRLFGNYSGIGSSDEITTPTNGVSSASSQQQTGEIARPGSNVSRAWDLDELYYDAHGNIVEGRLATDRPHVAKLYGSYQTSFGTQIGAFLYAGSGTPLSTYVLSDHTSGGMGSIVEGRGDMGRTSAYSRTDLLLSHELRLAAARRLRLELTILNLFNQKTSRHVFNCLNRGCGAGGQRASSAISLAKTNLLQGYDYRSLILQSGEGAKAFDPRYGMDDLFEPGARGYITVKFLF
jgi:carboxypeptidase family protein/TonB-dependent receptor-like protein